MQRVFQFLMAVAMLVCANGVDFSAASSFELPIAGDVVVLSELPDYAVLVDADEPESSSVADVANECCAVKAALPLVADEETSISAMQFAAAICCCGFFAMLGTMVIALRRRARLFALRAAEYAANASILETELAVSQCETQSLIAECDSLAREVDAREMQVNAMSRHAEELQCLYDAIVKKLRDVEVRCTSLQRELAESHKQCETIQLAAEESRRESEATIESMREAMQRAKSKVPPQKVWRTLDDIAFETSRLALEASMEAARAGTRGRPFADVARTALSLARRAAHAATAASS
ncbi:MAG: methyl-accepting chemotaxis protein [Thermoguttaceae bacterium]